MWFQDKKIVEKNKILDQISSFKKKLPKLDLITKFYWTKKTFMKTLSSKCVFFATKIEGIILYSK